MSMFKSYQKYSERELYDNQGAPCGVERIEVPRWSTGATINWLRAHGRDLAKTACRDGWHINLIDFVQHQHRLPNPAECDELVMDFRKIEAATDGTAKRPAILRKREEIKAELTKPIELQAAE